MRVSGVPYRTIALDEDGWGVRVIDQTKLPHRFEVVRLDTVEDSARAISTMVVRGAPLIGATAAYGVALAMRSDPTGTSLDAAIDRLRRLSVLDRFFGAHDGGGDVGVAADLVVDVGLDGGEVVVD